MFRISRREVLAGLGAGAALGLSGCTCNRVVTREVVGRVGKYIGGVLIDKAVDSLIDWAFEASGVTALWNQYIVDAPDLAQETPPIVLAGTDISAKFGRGYLWANAASAPSMYSIEPVLHRAVVAQGASYQSCLKQWGGPFSTVTWYARATGQVGAQWFQNGDTRHLVVFRDYNSAAYMLSCKDDYASTAMVYLTGAPNVQLRWPPGPQLQALVDAPWTFTP